MALNFPSNPTNGDNYTSGDFVWQYDGVAWNIVPSTGASYPNTFGVLSVAGSGNLTAAASSDTLFITPGENISLDVNNQTKTLTISSSASDIFSFNVAADDSTQRTIASNETIKFIGGAGIDTFSDDEGNIRIVSTASSATFSGLSDSNSANLTIDKIYEQAMVRFTLDNIGTTAYTFAPHYSSNNPNLYVISGTTVAFDLNEIPSLPFELQDATGTALTSNVTHVSTDGVVSTGASAQGKSSGTLYWRIPENLSGTYRYECQLYPAMFGSITIKRLSLV